MNVNKIEQKVREAGFSCILCGECCSGPGNEVIVTPLEIGILEKVTGMDRDGIADPYPEWICQEGFIFTFGWVLKRGKDGNCIFLENNLCRVYSSRPYLCKTYPFMLDEEDLVVSKCSGCTPGNKTVGANEITMNLLKRKEFEDIELKKTEKQYRDYSMSKQSMIVFDSCGAHEYLPPLKKL